MLRGCVGAAVGFIFVSSVSSTALAADPAADLARGDSLYARVQLAESRAAFQAALGAEPGNYRALCRLAQVESELGADASGKERDPLVAASVEHARAAIKVVPDSAQGHVWLAVALGRQALKEGPKASLSLSREIKSEVDRAIAIDPNIGRAYHVRAMWNRKLASLNGIERLVANTVLGGVPKGATMANAVSDLERAVELEPNYVGHRLELGRTYWMLRRYTDARRELEKAIALPPTSNARDATYQAEARGVLGKVPK